MAYSDKINDIRFKKYVRDTNRYAYIFAVILAVISVIGFFIENFALARFSLG